MKARSILFNIEMVQAILGGRKTQTRRTVKPQFWSTPFQIEGQEHYDLWFVRPTKNQEEQGHIVGRHWRCPFGDVGDLLYVRETWNAVHFSYDYELGCCDDGMWPKKYQKRKVVFT